MIAEVERDPVDAAAREDLQAAFEIEALHGRGPASLVYFARDRDTGGAVAVKVFPCVPGVSASVAEDFRAAVAQAATLQHQYIAAPYRAGAGERFFWYAVPRVAGWSLADWLESDRRLELQPCLRLVERVAGALDYAHGLGVVHGDLKPANVLLNVTPGAVVTDFYVPWVLETLGALGAGEGRVRRLEYVAPEEQSGEWPSPAGDQYALAAVTCHCLWGRAGLPATVPPRFQAVADVLRRALSDLPDRRFPGVRDFSRALHAAAAAAPAPERRSPVGSIAQVLADEDVLAEAAAALPTQRAAPGRHRWRWIAGVMAVLVAAAGAVLGVFSSGGEPGVPEPAPVAVAPSESSTSPAPSDTVTAAPIVAPPPAIARKAPPPAVPARLGHLFISATPWGEVFVDDVLIGNTPQAGVPVAPGAHRVRVARDGFEPFERSVRVAPGEDLRLTDIVLKELGT